MPQVIVFAIGAIALLFAFRWFRRETDRVEVAFRRVERRINQKERQFSKPLLFDESTGLYRPAE